MRPFIQAFYCLLLSAAAVSAQSVIVTFDGTTSSFLGTSSYTESGFNFYSSANEQLRFPGNYNGTAYLGGTSTAGGGGDLNITNTSGSAFSFLSAVFGNGNSTSTNCTVNGYLGGTLVATVQYTLDANSWAVKTLTADFANVNRVNIHYVNPNSGFFGLDNVNLAVVAAPEPSTLALAGLGGAGALLMYRRRRK
jgi:hypothetical protein